MAHDLSVAEALVGKEGEQSIDDEVCRAGEISQEIKLELVCKEKRDKIHAHGNNRCDTEVIAVSFNDFNLAWT